MIADDMVRGLLGPELPTGLSNALRHRKWSDLARCLAAWHNGRKGGRWTGPDSGPKRNFHIKRKSITPAMQS